MFAFNNTVDADRDERIGLASVGAFNFFVTRSFKIATFFRLAG
jgi:hypothetical protein